MDILNNLKNKLHTDVDLQKEPILETFIKEENNIDYLSTYVQRIHQTTEKKQKKIYKDIIYSSQTVYSQILDSLTGNSYDFINEKPQVITQSTSIPTPSTLSNFVKIADKDSSLSKESLYFILLQKKQDIENKISYEKEENNNTIDENSLPISPKDILKELNSLSEKNKIDLTIVYNESIHKNQETAPSEFQIDVNKIDSTQKNETIKKMLALRSNIDENTSSIKNNI